MDELFIEIKKHIENYKKQCSYDVPFDYCGLRNIIDKHKILNNHGSTKRKYICFR